MNKHYYVVEDADDPGTEFDTYQEACDYLNELRLKYPDSDVCDARILGPGSYYAEDFDGY